MASPLANRRKRKNYVRAEGYASGRLQAKAGQEEVQSHGIVFVDGDSGDHAWKYVLTPTRLIWGPRAWNPIDHSPEDYPIDGFEYRNVKTYRVHSDPNSPVIEVVQSDRAVTVSFLPAWAQGRELGSAIQAVVGYLCRCLTEAGADAQ